MSNSLEKGRKHSREWRKNHPTYYTDYLRKYHKEWRARKRAVGLCIRCGNKPVEASFATCVDCRKYNKTVSSPTIRDIRIEDRGAAASAASAKNRRCKICKSIKHNGRGWHIDHCHITKKFRGLLCNNCNLGLGQFKENINLLKQAITYLEDFLNVD